MLSLKKIEPDLLDKYYILNRTNQNILSNKSSHVRYSLYNNFIRNNETAKIF